MEEISIIMKNNMQQESGDNSVNVQVGGDASFGISATEARQIALDVFKANFYEFSEKAAKKALERAEEMTDEFVKKFYNEIPRLEEKLEDPAIQNALFNTQKEYAKSGDQNLRDNLLDILIKRIESENQTLAQIVLDEAIIVIPKLTHDQINILSLIFSTLLLNHHEVNNVKTFEDLINNKILIFLPKNELTYSFFTHLQFSGCSTLLTEGATYKSIIKILSSRYLGLISKGFSILELSNEFPNATIQLLPLIMPCLRNSTKLQFNTTNDEVLKDKISQNNLQQIEEKILSFQNRFAMSSTEFENYLNKLNSKFSDLINIWDNGDFKSIKLTSVGIAIAIINYNRVTNSNIDLTEFL